MFFEQPNLIFDIKNIAMLNTPPYFLPIKKNVENHVMHKMEVTVKETDVCITVDDLPESFSRFTLNDISSGYVSLVSNAYHKTQGAFLSITIYENDQIILDLDFTKIDDISHLEQWFDCYYFEELNGKKAIPSKITDYWSLNGGKLRCIKEQYGENDISEFCLLTYSKKSLKNFKAVIHFEQCGYRYGISFGCPVAHFPYYRDPQTMTIKAVSGGFAYIEQEGYRNLRGNIPRHLCTLPNYYIQSSHTPLPTFYASERDLTFTKDKHNLLFHISSDATYYFKNKIIFAKSGNITYIPPNMPYRSEYSIDKHIVVSFDILNGSRYEPESIIPSNPSEFSFLFDKMLKTFYLHSDIYHYECTYNLYKIYALIFKEKKVSNYSKPAQTKNHPKSLAPALEYLDTNFTNPNIRIPDLARMCHISETQFRELFNRHMGTTPQNYIQRMRIDFSIFLLDSKYYKIYEVAEKSGFQNPKYFSTVFRKFMKTSPTEWLENYTSQT